MNLEEILQVGGLDVCFIGPADLAATMGYLGQAGHREVVDLVKEVIKKVVKAGKVAGFLTGSKELIQAYSDAGALMCGVGCWAKMSVFVSLSRRAQENETRQKQRHLGINKHHSLSVAYSEQTILFANSPVRYCKKFLGCDEC